MPGWSLPPFAPGTVWLAGAGPGDPGLLTLLAVKALAEADVIVHDALISPEILAGAGPQAVLEDVGKRAGRHSCDQSEITAGLIAHARAGRRVLRLKGGDPLVFGRGGEEALALAGAGIRFRIVPGVTAGIGGLGLAGVPVTQRGINRVVAFVTGHGSDAPGGVDWTALAQAAPVIVLYMALGQIERIAAELVAAGRAPMTPVAVIAHASTERQQVVVTNLHNAARDVRRWGIAAPAIIAVGEVVHLHQALRPWLEVGSDGATLLEQAARQGERQVVGA